MQWTNCSSAKKTVNPNVAVPASADPRAPYRHVGNRLPHRIGEQLHKSSEVEADEHEEEECDEPQMPSAVRDDRERTRDDAEGEKYHEVRPWKDPASRW